MKITIKQFEDDREFVFDSDAHKIKIQAFDDNGGFPIDKRKPIIVTVDDRVFENVCEVKFDTAPAFGLEEADKLFAANMRVQRGDKCQ